MSLSDSPGRAPRVSFASIKSALAKQARDLSRAHRRWAALFPTYKKLEQPAGALQAGVEPLHLLHAILDHADVIAIDRREGYTKQVHMLVTLPVWLLERASVIAAYDEDDEDTDGGEDQKDQEPGIIDEPSLAWSDALVDQTRIAREHRVPHEPHGGSIWGFDCSDLELDTAELEPSQGNTNPSPSALQPGYVAFADQTNWAEVNRLDLEEQCEDEGSDAQELE